MSNQRARYNSTPARTELTLLVLHYLCKVQAVLSVSPAVHPSGSGDMAQNKDARRAASDQRERQLDGRHIVVGVSSNATGDIPCDVLGCWEGTRRSGEEERLSEELSVLPSGREWEENLCACCRNTETLASRV